MDHVQQRKDFKDHALMGELSVDEQEVDIGKNFIECPHCLSKNITIYEIFEEDARIDIKESYRDKLKDENRKSQDKFRQDIFSGDDLHRKSGKWYKKGHLSKWGKSS